MRLSHKLLPTLLCTQVSEFMNSACARSCCVDARACISVRVLDFTCMPVTRMHMSEMPYLHAAALPGW